jgi:hypothetical protein
LEVFFIMMKARVLVLTIMVLMIGSVGVFALSDTASHVVTMQVNEIALIDLNDTGAITLTTTAPAAGGDAVTGDSDATKLLQYTSLVATGLTRTITVQADLAIPAPAGTSLKLAAVVPGGCGTAAAQVTITNAAQSLITAIGSCATGTGASGAALTYTFSVDTVSSLVVGATTSPTITFTLADAG